MISLSASRPRPGDSGVATSTIDDQSRFPQTSSYGTYVNIDWRLYVIIDPDGLPDGALPWEVARDAIVGGAGVVQLRDKRTETRAVLRLAERICAVCREHGVPFIVNDRTDIALAVEADGVHLGPDDLPVDAARRIAPDLLIGASVGTPQAARAAVDAGADYLGSGAVFDASASKPNAHHNRGADALRQVVDAVDVPVVGIGGITPNNAHLAAQTGAAGIAVIRAISQAGDPEDAAARLLSAFQST